MTRQEQTLAQSPTGVNCTPVGLAPDPVLFWLRGVRRSVPSSCVLPLPSTRRPTDGPCRSCRVDWVPPWRAESKAAPCRPASHFLLILQLSRCLVVTAHFTEGRLCCRHWAKHFSR